MCNPLPNLAKGLTHNHLFTLAHGKKNSKLFTLSKASPWRASQVFALVKLGFILTHCLRFTFMKLLMIVPYYKNASRRPWYFFQKGPSWVWKFEHSTNPCLYYIMGKGPLCFELHIEFLHFERFVYKMCVLNFRTLHC